MLNRSQPRTAGGNLPLLPESDALSGSLSCCRLFNFAQKTSPPSLFGSVSAPVSTQHSRAVTVQKAVLQHVWEVLPAVYHMFILGRVDLVIEGSGACLNSL